MTIEYPNEDALFHRALVLVYDRGLSALDITGYTGEGCRFCPDGRPYNTGRMSRKTGEPVVECHQCGRPWNQAREERQALGSHECTGMGPEALTQTMMQLRPTRSVNVAAVEARMERMVNVEHEARVLREVVEPRPRDWTDDEWLFARIAWALLLAPDVGGYAASRRRMAEGLPHIPEQRRRLWSEWLGSTYADKRLQDRVRGARDVVRRRAQGAPRYLLHRSLRGVA
jgi:hypothetical protein